ncbi:SDR family oxidoreductase [Kineococcus glutinatus]|uniref:SDR family oxidoreductase n=1 Tax=Kineococcus glutinatus TaxID=1070872 RepID=A0ABP9I2C3_9ACTN
MSATAPLAPGADPGADPGRDFAGLAAVVTGGASGLGLATAKLLAARGARVVVLDLRPEDLPAPLEGERCDVGDDASVRRAVAAAVERTGRLDVVVSNAGIGARGSVEAGPDEGWEAEWARVLDVNVTGTARVVRACLPHLRRSPAAAVVVTCSIAATAGLPQRALYSASKGAVLALTRAMAADHLADGVRVNCVNPGTADTPWVQRLLDAADDPATERAALEARQPLGRLVSAEEVAFAVASLASPLASATTGTALEVDGGMAGLRLPPRRQP